jgi:hypothetical protein
MSSIHIQQPMDALLSFKGSGFRNFKKLSLSILRRLKAPVASFIEFAGNLPLYKNSEITHGTGLNQTQPIGTLSFTNIRGHSMFVTC